MPFTAFPIEIKSICFSIPRLEKSAEDFQTSVDKQKARVFQDEVKFLQKIIEKASKKFRRKKLKFDVNKKVKNFFDTIESIGTIEKEIVDLNSTRENASDGTIEKISDQNAGELDKADNINEDKAVNIDADKAVNIKLDKVVNIKVDKAVDIKAGKGDGKASVDARANNDTHLHRGNSDMGNDKGQERTPHRDSHLPVENNVGSKLTGDIESSTSNSETTIQSHNQSIKSGPKVNHERLGLQNNCQESNVLHNIVNNKHSDWKRVNSTKYEKPPIKVKNVATEPLNTGDNDAYMSIEDGKEKTADESTVNTELTEAEWVKFREQERQRNKVNQSVKVENPKPYLEYLARENGDNVTHKQKPDRISVLQELCKRLDTQNNTKPLETKNDNSAALNSKANDKTFTPNNNGENLNAKTNGAVFERNKFDSNDKDKLLYSHDKGERQNAKLNGSVFERHKPITTTVKRVKSRAVGTDDDSISYTLISDKKTIPDKIIVPRTGNIWGKTSITKVSNVSQDDSAVPIQYSDDSGTFNKPKGIIKNWSKDNKLRRSRSDSSKYSYLRDKKYMEAKKDCRHVKFADDVDLSDNSDNETPNNGINDGDVGVNNVSENSNNSIDGFGECGDDALACLRTGALDKSHDSEQSVSRKVKGKTYSDKRTTEDCKKDKGIVGDTTQDDRMLLKFKTALDNLRGVCVESSNNDNSSNSLRTNLDQRKSTVDAAVRANQEHDNITVPNLKHHSKPQKIENDELKLNKSHDRSSVKDIPKPDLFDLNNFRTTIDNLKEEIISARQKHDNDSQRSPSEASKYLANKANKTITDINVTEHGNSNVDKHQFDTLSDSKDLQGHNSLANSDQQDSDPRNISDHHLSKSSISTDQYVTSEHNLSNDHEDSEPDVSKDHVTDILPDHVTVNVNDFKAPGARGPRQTNGVKVSNARIAAYVRRRLKAIELPSELSDNMSSLSSNFTGSSSTNNGNNVINNDTTDSKLDDSGDSMAAAHPVALMGSTMKDMVFRQPRAQKQRLPSSKEMLFDS